MTADRAEAETLARENEALRVRVEVLEQEARLYRDFFDDAPIGKSMTDSTGLHICRSILESFGGRIEVESAIGLGSTFRVHLRIARFADAEEVSP
jgi:light-regulated signal transduction histidine kinase (bacteriophytochrome)